jgi:hypothetical protein
MLSKKLLLTVLTVNFALLLSCAQTDESTTETAAKEVIVQTTKKQKKSLHPYGAWACPDNFGGFPPINIEDLNLMSVVKGRLPTEEETRNGKSLMFIDIAKIPDAKPLDLGLPRLARYYSEHTKINELVIIIQIVTAENDTVVGFRNVNGGNGSAWFNEVTFLSDSEINKLSPTPFVFLETEINACRKEIWDILINPIYSKVLGESISINTFIESDLQKKPMPYFKQQSDSTLNKGLIAALWEDMYIQVDFDFENYHYVQKFLLLDNEETKGTQLQIVSGPYSEDLSGQKIAWQKWIERVKELSEHS